MHFGKIKYLVFAVLFLMVQASCTNDPRKLEPTFVIANDVDDILLFQDSLIKPIDYINLLSLEQLPIEQRKVTFIHQILPSVLICKYNLELQKRHIQKFIEKDSARLTRKQRRYLDSLYVKYKTSNPNELLNRLHTHPVSIVLAQAALESAWGTSRFYSEGNNLFGIWSFNSRDNRMASRGLRDGEPVYVKRYRSLAESVEDYFLVIGRGPFRKFRQKRLETENPYILVNFLDNYSEKNKEYAHLLRNIIEMNDLTRFDHYHLDPEFIR